MTNLIAEIAFRSVCEARARGIVAGRAKNLTYVKPDGEDKEKPYFQGDEFEDKLQNFYAKEESPDERYSVISKKVSKLIAFWFFNQASKKEDFEDFDKKIEAGEL